MSVIQNKILNLLKTTKIDGRYRSIFKLYPDNSDYEKLAYHNVDHVRSVLNLFEVLRKLTGKNFDKAKLEAAYLAAVFHDIQHSGCPDTHVDEQGGNNIGRAVAAFTAWAIGSGKIPLNGDTTKIADAILLIKMTEYPAQDITIKDPELLELSNMLRDADMLWGTMPDNAAQCMIGMWAERFNAGLETGEISVEKVLVGQINFIKNYQPLSAAGRTYKNAMFELATEAWAAVALEYMRQLEAAKLVESMTQSQLLAAMSRNHVRGKIAKQG